MAVGELPSVHGEGTDSLRLPIGGTGISPIRRGKTPLPTPCPPYYIELCVADRFRLGGMAPGGVPGSKDMKRVTMNHINAYLDGALDDKERQEFEQSVEDDADAKAVVTFHRSHVEELHRLYDPVLEEPVPARMLELLRQRRKS
ncbi:hypothetical protein GCM10022293_56660 [Azospirillum formosense]